MANLTNAAENSFLDFLLRGQAWSLPASLHIGLFTAAPGEAGGGTEVTAGGYARLGVVRNLTNWSGTQAPGSTTASTGTSGRSSNNATLIWPTATADWGTVTHIAVFDAPTGGTMLLYASLAAAQTVNTGGVFEMLANALGVTAA